MDLDLSYFFDSCGSISSFDEFFDYLSPHMPTSLFSDWLTLDELSSNVYLDCSWDTNSVPTMTNLPKCYHTLGHGGVLNSFDDTSASDPPFPIVIESGASLSISSLKLDLVGQY